MPELTHRKPALPPAGFAQAGHGKRTGLARMHAGDRILHCSPKLAFGRDETLPAFTALGEVADDEIVQVEMSPGFKPSRRNVKYLKSGGVKIGPLINDLQFIRNKKSWGAALLRLPVGSYRTQEMMRTP